MLALGHVVAAVAVLIVIAIVERGHHLAHLGGDVGIAVEASRLVNPHAHCASDATHGSCVAIGHHDVEDGACSLGVIFCAWVGNHLYLLNHAGGNHLEDFLHVHAGKGWVGMAVAVHLERGGPLHTNLVLTIDAYHGHLLEHVENVAGATVGIGLHVVGEAVYLGLHQLALSGYHHLLEHRRLGCQHDGAQLCHWCRGANLKIAVLRCHAHKLQANHVLARLANLVVDLSKGIAHTTCNHFTSVVAVVDIDSGKGNTLALAVVDMALHTILLCHCRNHTNTHQ